MHPTLAVARSQQGGERQAVAEHHQVQRMRRPDQWRFPIKLIDKGLGFGFCVTSSDSKFRDSEPRRP